MLAPPSCGACGYLRRGVLGLLMVLVAAAGSQAPGAGAGDSSVEGETMALSGTVSPPSSDSAESVGSGPLISAEGTATNGGYPLTASPATTAPSRTSPASNPFLGAHGYVDPHSDAAVAARARRSWDPAGAAALDKIAVGSSADWYGAWVPTRVLASRVSQRLATQRAAGALPVLVAYAIPHRDCGNYSGGGERTSASYRAWIAQLAAGIGSTKAVVVLEPDALAQLDCLSPSGQHDRIVLLAGAVRTLTAHPSVAVYVDAGGPGWQRPSVMAARLTAANIARARGFSVNVSNFNTNATSQAYGDTLSGLIGGKPFLVDTSRNGRGPGSTWCNPSGRALGSAFTTATGDWLTDAFTWIKMPGRSDGVCNGGPRAGQFWTDYAIGLARRAR